MWVNHWGSPKEAWKKGEIPEKPRSFNESSWHNLALLSFLRQSLGWAVPKRSVVCLITHLINADLLQRHCSSMAALQQPSAGPHRLEFLRWLVQSRKGYFEAGLNIGLLIIFMCVSSGVSTQYRHFFKNQISCLKLWTLRILISRCM